MMWAMVDATVVIGFMGIEDVNVRPRFLLHLGFDIQEENLQTPLYISTNCIETAFSLFSSRDVTVDRCESLYDCASTSSPPSSLISPPR
jgi:hypothetical protein